MTKLNTNVYRKLLAQAQEAKNRGLVKLAENIESSIEEGQPEEYSFSNLQDEVEKDLWSMAAKIIKYYNVSKVDAEKIQDTIYGLSTLAHEQIQHAIGADEKLVGDLEPKVPGQTE